MVKYNKRLIWRLYIPGSTRGVSGSLCKLILGSMDYGLRATMLQSSRKNRM